MEFESTEKFQMIYETLKAAIAYFRKQLFSNKMSNPLKLKCLWAEECSK